MSNETRIINYFKKNNINLESANKISEILSEGYLGILDFESCFIRKFLIQNPCLDLTNYINKLNKIGQDKLTEYFTNSDSPYYSRQGFCLFLNNVKNNKI
jgi:hypothetical protein